MDGWVAALDGEGDGGVRANNRGGAQRGMGVVKQGGQLNEHQTGRPGGVEG